MRMHTNAIDIVTASFFPSFSLTVFFLILLKTNFLAEIKFMVNTGKQWRQCYLETLTCLYFMGREFVCLKIYYSYFWCFHKVNHLDSRTLTLTFMTDLSLEVRVGVFIVVSYPI